MTYIPSYTTSAITTYICVREAAKAIDWYVDVFGATEEGDRYVESDGRVGHAAINIDGAQIMLSDAYPDYGSVSPEPGNTTATYALNLYVPDVDATIGKAEQHGAVVQRPAEDQFYGSRMGTIIDPFGVRWMIATHIRDVSDEELAKLAADFGGAEPESAS